MLDDIYMGGQLSKQDDMEMLIHFADYETKGTVIPFVYQESDADSLRVLRKRYNLDEIAGEGSELKRILRLRQWVYNQLRNDSQCFFEIERVSKMKWNTITVLNELREKPFLVDCGTYAVVMTEVMLAMGWKAKWVQCLPVDLRYNESHCVTHVWSNEFNKWIIVDAAQDIFYFNSKGIPFGLPDLRRAIINRERVLIFSDAKKEKGRIWLNNYWIKNVFRFHCLLNSCFSMFDVETVNHVFLNPKGYNIEDKIVNKIDRSEVYTHVQDDVAFWRE